MQYLILVPERQQPNTTERLAPSQKNDLTLFLLLTEINGNFSPNISSKVIRNLFFTAINHNETADTTHCAAGRTVLVCPQGNYLVASLPIKVLHNTHNYSVPTTFIRLQTKAKVS